MDDSSGPMKEGESEIATCHLLRKVLQAVETRRENAYKRRSKKIVSLLVAGEGDDDVEEEGGEGSSSANF